MPTQYRNVIRIRSEASSRPVGKLLPTKTSFGEMVRAARIGAGLSMRDFCAAARKHAKPEGSKGRGLGLKALWRIETGRVVPRPASVFVINRVLGTFFQAPGSW